VTHSASRSTTLLAAVGLGLALAACSSGGRPSLPSQLPSVPSSVPAVPSVPSSVPAPPTAIPKPPLSTVAPTTAPHPATTAPSGTGAPVTTAAPPPTAPATSQAPTTATTSPPASTVVPATTSAPATTNPPATTGAPASTAAPPTTQAPGGTSSGTPVWPWILAAVVALGGAVAYFVARTRRKQRHLADVGWVVGARTAIDDTVTLHETVTAARTRGEPSGLGAGGASKAQLDALVARLGGPSTAAGDPELTAASGRLAAALHAWAFGVEADELLRGGPTPPTAEELERSALSLRSREDQLAAAVRDLRRRVEAVDPTPPSPPGPPDAGTTGARA